MPIRFACPNCGQRLSVGSHKAGKATVCPKCQGSITIPTPSAPVPVAESESPVIDPEPPPLDAPPSAEEAPRFSFEPTVEIVYDRGTTAPPPSARKKGDDEALDLDRVALPRYVLFVQGGLIAVVGIVCFLLGMAVGGAVTERGSGAAADIPVTVSGTVAVASGGSRTPDGGATIIFLPANAKPDEKGLLAGVRPGDDPARAVSFRNYLKLLGGGMDWCDERGQYSVQLPDRGRYYLLAISSKSKPSPDREPPPDEIVQMGRFLDLSDNPLAEFRYQWRLENFRGSQRANVTFD